MLVALLISWCAVACALAPMVGRVLSGRHQDAAPGPYECHRMHPVDRDVSV